MLQTPSTLNPLKFRDPRTTAKGEKRATVALRALETLWFNTGTLCNLTCRNCYIESSPRNDRLAYLTAAEVGTFLNEVAQRRLPVGTVGFTGGEPFMNPDLVPMLADTLGRGHAALVLTNAMRPMLKMADQLDALRVQHGKRLRVRVSIDHYGPALHEAERGPRSWAPTLEGLRWLATRGFVIEVAGRLFSNEPEPVVRQGFAQLFRDQGIPLDAADPVALVLFPEMDASVDVPEITEACWSILGRMPDSVMCSNSRMVVRRREADRPSVVACTLLPYETEFDLGATLAEAAGPVALNHPHCARFCVLGGGACSREGRPMALTPARRRGKRLRSLRAPSACAPSCGHGARPRRPRGHGARMVSRNGGAASSRDRRLRAAASS